MPGSIEPSHPIHYNAYIGRIAATKRQPKTRRVIDLGETPPPFHFAPETGRAQHRLTSGKPKRKHGKARGGQKVRHDCAVWTLADLQYQGFTIERRTEWRRALKKPNMSAYDLWMHEAIPHHLRGLNPPDHPSNSGGYGTTELNPGTVLPAYTGLTNYSIDSFKITDEGPGTWGHKYRATWRPYDNIRKKIPWFALSLYFGWQTTLKTYYAWQNFYAPDLSHLYEIPSDAVPRAECGFHDFDTGVSIYFQADLKHPWRIYHQFRFFWDRTV